MIETNNGSYHEVTPQLNHFPDFYSLIFRFKFAIEAAEFDESQEVGDKETEWKGQPLGDVPGDFQEAYLLLLPEGPGDSNDARQEGEEDGEVTPEGMAALDESCPLDEGQDGLQGVDHVVKDEERQEGEAVLRHGVSEVADTLSLFVLTAVGILLSSLIE